MVVATVRTYAFTVRTVEKRMYGVCTVHNRTYSLRTRCVRFWPPLWSLTVGDRRTYGIGYRTYTLRTPCVRSAYGASFCLRFSSNSHHFSLVSCTRPKILISIISMLKLNIYNLNELNNSQLGSYDCIYGVQSAGNCVICSLATLSAAFLAASFCQLAFFFLLFLLLQVCPSAGSAQP